MKKNEIRSKEKDLQLPAKRKVKIRLDWDNGRRSYC